MKNIKNDKKRSHKASSKKTNHKDFSKKNNNGKFSKQDNLVKGKIVANQKGYAFLVRDNSSEDIFIPSSGLNGAIHKDEVLVKVSPAKIEGKSGEGKVVRILKHNLKTIVGEIQVFKGFSFVVADEKRVFKDIFIKKDKSKNAVYGDKVVVNITKYDGKNLEGEVTEVLGPNNSSPYVDVMSIVRNYELIEEFPKQVVDSAKQAALLPISKISKNRTDFRDHLTITIDGDDSKDFDDAVSLEKVGENYCLGVHIADVGEYVPVGSELDKEAFKRGTSVYFPNLVLPMLPQEISNGCCSLVENQDRLTLSCVMTISPSGKLLKHNICESVIRSNNRMTYNKVTKILQGDENLCNQYSHLLPMLKDMEKLCLILEKVRKDAGSLDFDIPEPKIITDETTMEVISLEKRPRTISERIIESFMVLANETVAKHFQQLKIPFVYRVHEKPDEDKIRSFNDFVSVLGLSLKDIDVEPKDIAQFLEKLENNPMKEVVNKVLLRTMQKAKYSPDCLGHFGLALTYYCHFTSPIRRYPDLTIHRIIKQYLRNQLDESTLKKIKNFVVSSSNQSSETEVSAEKAERDVDDYYKARYMRDSIGNEYEGIISGVMPYGIFIELDNTVEGFAGVETLDGNGYVYYEKQLKLSNGVKTYKLGDKVKVKVVSVNLSERRVNFKVI